MTETETQQEDAAGMGEQWLLLGAIVGMNQIAKDSPTLGQKAYARVIRDTLEEKYKADFPEAVDALIREPDILTLPTVPSVSFLARDIELMRACVREHDIASGALRTTFVVTKGCYSSYGIESVWSTREAAEKAAVALNGGPLSKNHDNDVQIEEWVLDVTEENAGHMWRVHVDTRHGGTTACRVSRAGRVPERVYEGPTYAIVFVDMHADDTDDTTRAIKVAKDMLAERLANISPEDARKFFARPLFHNQIVKAVADGRVLQVVGITIAPGARKLFVDCDPDVGDPQPVAQRGRVERFELTPINSAIVHQDGKQIDIDKTIATATPLQGSK